MEQTVRNVFIGYDTELPERIGKTIVLEDMEIAVFKLTNGNIYAIENRCPHRGGVLSEGMVSGEHVFCPLHDWKINMKDGLVQAPDEGCVQTYDVIHEDDKVYVQVPLTE
ncbi:assimilatory nitrite reductase subunit [Gracilibacillus halophilus YIM-C55.5]|uniref:Assimilatory nitrite reductase subunit n=1 Tax=Gracilibacillus halophilus YIM-C55.5 TaxID=1308866 RepID=N4WA41_9BACI|nr:nitrite reductase small subunit NirD [Gracilibacillus halophilus]ENH97158.1 assimilatory nitrite reductase subunit [Gracilibacillus halophilus YIM-C55.5]